MGHLGLSPVCVGISLFVHKRITGTRVTGKLFPPSPTCLSTLKNPHIKTISETFRNVDIKTALQRLNLTQHLPPCGRKCSCPWVTGLNRSHCHPHAYNLQFHEKQRRTITHGSTWTQFVPHFTSCHAALILNISKHLYFYSIFFQELWLHRKLQRHLEARKEEKYLCSVTFDITLYSVLDALTITKVCLFKVLCLY